MPVQTVSILGYLEPLSALIFSAVILGEKLSLVQIAGAMLILGDVAFGELFRPEKKRATGRKRQNGIMNE
ncbi:EamA family transporter [Bacillus salitolerans]|uniref:EamA family transporter n=1 Tax=Bacillus salitolerans TaxID=1437434 RepID=A0ABW4LSP1_9BACI